MVKTYRCRVFLIAIFNFISISKLFAQDNRNQFTVTSDNDQYVNPNHDRYYTDGVVFNFTHALKHDTIHSSLAKKTLEFEFGQRIYNSYTASARRLQSDPFVFQRYAIDRPFTAYLYVGAALNFLYKNENALRLDAEIGTIGPAALGEQAQTGFHNFFGLYKARGWPYQLNNAPGVNLRGDYKMLLYRNSDNWFDMAFNPTAWIGNTFTGASAGMQFRFGHFGKFYESAITNSRVSSNAGEQQTHEFYFFTTPQINYVAYDATIEGGLGLSDKGPVTFGIYHFVYQQQFGLEFASARWSANYIAYVRSREVKSTALGDQWASVSLAYRFGKI
jgi:lipid A 3-O-deacylase